MHTHLTTLPGFDASFLGHRFRAQPNYGFLLHYTFFLENQQRWTKWEDINNRIVAPVSDDPVIAWREWRQFRSAQAEISAAYLIEKYLGGKIQDLEVQRPGALKSCDILATFGDQRSLYLEVKAQSGQQHGSQHPLSTNQYSFTPQGEDDLRSWLFEPRKSLSTNEAMVPYCTQASSKGADVLIAMVDIMQWETEGMFELGRFLVPDAITEGSQVLLTPSGDDGLNIFSFEAGASTRARLGSLKEVWLFKESASNGLLIIRIPARPLILNH